MVFRWLKKPTENFLKFYSKKMKEIENRDSLFYKGSIPEVNWKCN